jgi:hypothetical protein
MLKVSQRMILVERLLKKKFGIGRNILVIKLPHNLDA